MKPTMNDRLPRLGDRADLRIEIQPSAVSSYRQTRLENTGVSLTDAEAHEELEDVLLHSHVTYSSGEDMTVRAKLRRLGVDVQSDLVRVSPTHVRCSLAQCRRYDTTTRQGSRGGNAEYATFRVYDAKGDRIGIVRAPRRGGGPLEYRAVAGESGSPAPFWVAIPAYVRDLARLPNSQAEKLRAFLTENGEVL